MNLEQVKDLVKSHEGLRLHVYRDSLGYRTIGYGCNLEPSYARVWCWAARVQYDKLLAGEIELTEAQAETILDEQLEKTVREARKVFGGQFDLLPDNAAAIVCDMIFNLGPTRFAEFHRFIEAVKRLDWNEAVSEMLDSVWAKQVPSRVADDVRLIGELVK